MNTIGFEKTNISGPLHERALRNMVRMERENYQLADVVKEEEYPWPGDMEGRYILANVLLARATGREPRLLGKVMEALPGKLNDRGFLGRALGSGLLDEQQLSGHGWLLRGLCEHSLWTGNGASLEMAERIVEGLLLPARGYYAKYPSRPEDRVFDGHAIGALQSNQTGNWYSSTDIGCAFIMMDGASQVLELRRSSALADLLQEMAEAYLRLDFVGISCQTHATLSGLRAILRLHSISPSETLLNGARRIWDLYVSQGMTENYANHNWFGRPHWTEPCAIVDAFMVAVELWRVTGDVSYLNQAHVIYFNGLGYAQRPNGGFGCDVCAGAETPFLAPKEDIYEAWWCCTMRGGEGLARVIEYACFQDGDTLTMPFMWDSTLEASFDDGGLRMRTRTRYPEEGELLLSVAGNSRASDTRIRVFVPEGAAPGSVKLQSDGREIPCVVTDGFAVLTLPGGITPRFELTFDLPPRAVPALNAANKDNCHTWRRGPVILGCKVGETPVAIPTGASVMREFGPWCKVEGSGVVLGPLYDLIHVTEAASKTDRRQILFQNG